MSAKSAIKALVPENKTSTLFRWVAALTGSKNTLKGLGFFAGGALLSVLGFEGAVFSMGLGLLCLLMLLFALFEAKHDGVRSKAPIKKILSKSRRINVISIARFFLFGGRDAWFVVGIPSFSSRCVGVEFCRDRHVYGGMGNAIWRCASVCTGNCAKVRRWRKYRDTIH